ncbi:MAG: hypothetical protein EB056_06825 [Verrucomicrobia bacterium]|nr:hypothetical protein [Verrucomicrobiota bacterium]
MRRSIEWTEKAEGDRPKITYRVSKEQGSESWETPKMLPSETWDRLVEEVEKRYQRRRARHEDVLLVRSTSAKAPKLP